MQSCYGTNLQVEVECVVMRLSRQNGAFSADVVKEGADESPALDLGNLSVMAGYGVVCDACVGELDADPTSTGETFVDFSLSPVTPVSTAVV